MSDELRAARERLRRDIANGEVTRDRVPDAVIGDVVMLAMNDVAEHPADDDEPVTREWESTLVECANEWCVVRMLYSGIKCYGLAIASRITTSVVRVVYSPTRRDVRRLLAALGIEVVK